MIYVKVKIGSKTFWTANPRNWEELAYTINYEEPFLDYNPNEQAPPDPNEDLLKMFL